MTQERKVWEIERMEILRQIDETNRACDAQKQTVQCTLGQLFLEKQELLQRIACASASLGGRPGL